MRVLLINPGANIKTGLQSSIKGVTPLGLVYMGTILGKRHDVRIVDLVCEPRERLFETVKDFRPDLIGVSITMAASFNRAMQIISEIKEFYTDAVFVAGGPHINFLSRHFGYFFSEGYLDYITEGESEFILSSLADCLEDHGNVKDVPGIFYGSGGKVAYTGKAPPVDINTLPTPDFSLVDVTKYGFLWIEDPHVTLDWSRGCNYNCVYCSCKRFFGNLRIKTVEKMIGDLKELKKRHPIKTVFLVDDDFLGDVEKARSLLEAIVREDIGLSFIMETRIDTLIRNQDIIQLMGEAGIRSMFIGIEDVNEKILEYYNKGYDRNVFTRENVREVIRKLREAGIFVMALMMVGSPLETLGTVKEKAEFIDYVDPNHVIYQIFTPHGELLDKYFDEGRVRIKDFDYWDCEHFVCDTPLDQTEARKIISNSIKTILKRNHEENEKSVIGRKHNAEIAFDYQ